MLNFLNSHLLKADFQLVFICSLYGHLQYHFRMEEASFIRRVLPYQVVEEVRRSRDGLLRDLSGEGAPQAALEVVVPVGQVPEQDLQVGPRLDHALEGHILPADVVLALEKIIRKT